MIPHAIGPYRVVRQLGEGGQGVVYLAVAPDGRPVAVKVLREGVSGDDRFAKEVTAARRVEPFCIAQVLDASLSGWPYIVTEYVEGPSLQQAGRHAGADLQRLAVSTATALTAIHGAGVVHRDFKPANVLLGRDGPRVIDFGIARAADSGASVSSGIVGTPAYMAPEQLAGEAVGAPADVFAWGCVIVFAATGTPPFGEDTLPAIINRILHNEPQLGELEQPLRSLVHGCLAKDPRNRPAMREVLLHLLGGRDSSAPGGSGARERVPQQAPAPPEHAAVPPGRAAWREGAAQGDSVPPGRAARRESGRSGRVVRRFPLVAVVAGVAAALVTGVIVWRSGAGDDPSLTAADASPTPQGTPAAKKPATRRPSATPSVSPSKRRGTPTTTPTVRRTGAKPTPTATPTVRRTTPTATPTVRRTSAKPTPTAAKAASFTIAYVRSQGSSKINTSGITCYSGSMNFGVGVDSSQPAARWTYQWIFNGKVIESGSDRLQNGSRSDYVTSKDTIQPPDGTHTITYRITSPGSRSKSTTFVMCPTGP